MTDYSFAQLQSRTASDERCSVTVCEFAGSIAIREYTPPALPPDALARLAETAATSLGWRRDLSVRGGWRKVAA